MDRLIFHGPDAVSAASGLLISGWRASCDAVRSMLSCFLLALVGAHSADHAARCAPGSFRGTKKPSAPIVHRGGRRCASSSAVPPALAVSGPLFHGNSAAQMCAVRFPFAVSGVPARVYWAVTAFQASARGCSSLRRICRVSTVGGSL